MSQQNLERFNQEFNQVLSHEEQVLCLVQLYEGLSPDQKKRFQLLINPFAKFNFASNSDMMFEVVSFLDYKELVELRTCSKFFERLVLSDDLWKPFLKKHFPAVVITKELSCYQQYKYGKCIWMLL